MSDDKEIPLGSIYAGPEVRLTYDGCLLPDWSAEIRFYPDDGAGHGKPYWSPLPMEIPVILDSYGLRWIWSCTFNDDGSITSVDHINGVVAVTPAPVCAPALPAPPSVDVPVIFDDDSEEDALPVASGWTHVAVEWKPQPKECGECADSGRCSRIGQCLRYRCGFGEASPP